MPPPLFQPMSQTENEPSILKNRIIRKILQVSSLTIDADDQYANYTIIQP